MWRVYRELRLNLPRRGKKRLPARINQSLEEADLAVRAGHADDVRVAPGQTGVATTG